MKVGPFAEGCQVAQAWLVREVELCTARDGREHLRLVLGEGSGDASAPGEGVAAVVWDGLEAARALCHPGATVFVTGRYSECELVVSGVRAVEPGDPITAEGPAREASQMESDLRELLDTVQNPHLRRLLAGVFGARSPVWAQYREAPAAKRYHQAYRHGLLEHCLTVAQAVSAISATFPGIDRDVAVAGALLHDLGKLEAYEVTELGIEMSDQGRLYGEIPLGYYRVRRMIERIPGFPEHLAQAVLHIILSHHGSLEHGSPVVPCTREATLVHMIDNLGGRLGSFDRLEKELPAGRRWSPYDKALGGGAYFAQRPHPSDAPAGEPGARDAA